MPPAKFILCDCTLGDYKASQLNGLKVHKKSVHEGIRYPCQICNYKAPTQGGLTRHIKLQNKVPDMIYLCVTCNKEFRNATKFIQKGTHNKHVKSVHLQHKGQQSYSCSNCNYKYVQGVPKKTVNKEIGLA